MPFCTQCGHEARTSDAFCGFCGAAQSTGVGAPPPRPGANFGTMPAGDPLAGFSPRTASILCYIPAVGWIGAIFVLASRRFKENHLIRFHAFQGLYLFAAWLVVDWVIGPLVRAMPGHAVPTELLFHGLLLFVSIFMMVKASQDEAYVLPIIGELAQRSAIEH